MKTKIIELGKDVKSDVSNIGGKGISLLKLMDAGFNVPNGFIIPVSYFFDTLKTNCEYEKIVKLCESTTMDNFEKNSKILQNIIINCNITFNVDEQLQKLKQPVAVRSSSISEDGEVHSFAGLHDSFLNIGKEDVITYIKKVWASLFNDRALSYRLHKGLPLFEGMAVIVLEMVQANCAGVVFTMHPVEQNRFLVEVTSGTGDSLVDGSITPDRFLFNRKTLEILSAETFQKPIMSKKLMKTLVNNCMEIEKLYGRPQDIEWAVSDKLYFLQSRDVVIIDNMRSEVIEIEKLYKWKLLSSKKSPTLWKSWTAKGNTRDNLLKYTEEKLFMPLKQDEYLYLTDNNELESVRNYCESMIEKDIMYLNRVQEKCMKIHTDFINFCIENRKRDFAKLSNTEIISTFKKYIEKIVPTASFRTNIFLLGSIITDLINEEIEKIKTSGTEVDFYYELVTPVKDLPFAEMQKNMLIIGSKMEQESLNFDNEEIKSLIKDHVEKYSWLMTHRYFGEPLTENDVMKVMGKNSGNFREKLDEISINNENRKYELDRVKSINKTIGNLLCVAQEYAYLQTYRIDVVNEGNFYVRNMFDEICSRIGIEYDHLIYLREDEILNALNGDKFNYHKLIATRQEYYVIYNVNDNEIHTFEGNINKYITENNETEEKVKSDILKGKVAQRGKVKGTVKVVKSKQELNKLNEGDIIVCPMTMPEMVIGLLKCGGMITDEGGIACHAAQISRELKVPCITGTGNASKLLQDGNTVEIVAEGIDGEIKILK
jgi:pyruvate,water dikinase